MENSKSITGTCCVLAALVLATFNTNAAPRVATAALTSQSMVGPSGNSNFDYRTFFSTPDSPTGLPLHTIGDNGSILVNHEWRPVTNQPAVYQTDAFVVSSQTFPGPVTAEDILFGGKLSFAFPTNDVDTNGVLDFLQFNIGMDGVVPGMGITEYTSSGQRFNTNIFGFAEGAGSVGGPSGGGGLAYEWNITEGDDYLGEETFGILELLYMNGSVTNRGNASLVFGLRSTDRLGRTNSFGAFSYRGVAPARFRGDELRIGKFNLKRNDGVKIRVNKTTLRRVNGKYIGKLTFNDWNPATPWADYTEWAIEISEFVRP